LVTDRIELRKSKIADRHIPMQERSRQRREEILGTTATLLERVGFDDLTTILIASELKISVGSLYHYFPNKQAILYALGEHWLEEYSIALEDVASRDLESLDLAGFVELILSRLLDVYREQRGILPLVQAMWAVPELRDLDERHDDMVIGYMEAMFPRLGVTASKPELNRRGRVWLEMTHALLLTITAQPAKRAQRSYADLQRVAMTLLQN
jgi:AcrR family transcriptional regulator